jgi:copper chaperone NosL
VTRGGVDHGRRRALRRIAELLLAVAAGTVVRARAQGSGSVSAEDAARRDDDPGPGRVDVGTDRCPYCSMSVIDARFAAQQVTVNGRVHVYDAIECLVDHLAGHGGPALAAGWCFVADHAASTRTTASLVSVHAATILHHARLRTPMGGGLVGFGDEATAADFVRERGLSDVRAWSWDALVARSRERPWVPAL